MSTSTNIPGFPDASLLEQLANRFFSALPGESPAPAKYEPVLHPGNNVDINDPQTSLPDPNLTGGIPKSVAGSGVSPSSYQLPYPKEEIPFQGDHSFEWAELLKGIQTFVPTGQLPFSFSGTEYYFLPGKQAAPFDVNRIKQDFPILQERVNGRPLIWLDNAATTQKPKQVIERISYFYQHENSNIHRAAHALAAKATDAYEAARSKVQRFLSARSPNEIIFVRGATEAINLVAKSWGEEYL